jgi:hypothetical protein
MQKSGVIGDNLEIETFAHECRVNVKTYQRDQAYVICVHNDSGRNSKTDTQEVHIAYHLSFLPHIL